MQSGNRVLSFANLRFIATRYADGHVFLGLCLNGIMQTDVSFSSSSSCLFSPFLSGTVCKWNDADPEVLFQVECGRTYFFLGLCVNENIISTADPKNLCTLPAELILVKLSWVLFFTIL